jgi:hypothetical protein
MMSTRITPPETYMGTSYPIFTGGLSFDALT